MTDPNTKAPERIYIDLTDLNISRRVWYPAPLPNDPKTSWEHSNSEYVSYEYVRADLLTAERERARRLAKGIESMTALMNESLGVYGLHLNGDFANWPSLKTGGRYEEWLHDYCEVTDEARAVLAEAGE